MNKVLVYSCGLYICWGNCFTCIDWLVLMNTFLYQFAPESRIDLLRTCAPTLKRLEVRAIPKEQDLCLQLPNLECLTLDQGIDLVNLGRLICLYMFTSTYRL